MGFTSTYNDFEYTGAVFRIEQSFSTKEHIRKLPAGIRAQCRPHSGSEAYEKNAGVFDQQKLPYLLSSVAVDGRL